MLQSPDGLPGGALFRPRHPGTPDQLMQQAREAVCRGRNEDLARTASDICIQDPNKALELLKKIPRLEVAVGIWQTDLGESPQSAYEEVIRDKLRKAILEHELTASLAEEPSVDPRLLKAATEMVLQLDARQSARNDSSDENRFALTLSIFEHRPCGEVLSTICGSEILETGARRREIYNQLWAIIREKNCLEDIILDPKLTGEDLKRCIELVATEELQRAIDLMVERPCWELARGIYHQSERSPQKEVIRQKVWRLVKEENLASDLATNEELSDFPLCEAVSIVFAHEPDLALQILESRPCWETASAIFARAHEEGERIEEITERIWRIAKRTENKTVAQYSGNQAEAYILTGYGEGTNVKEITCVKGRYDFYWEKGDPRMLPEMYLRRHIAPKLQEEMESAGLEREVLELALFTAVKRLQRHDFYGRSFYRLKIHGELHYEWLDDQQAFAYRLIPEIEELELLFAPERKVNA